MKIVRWVALIGVLLMGVALTNGFVNGDILREGGDLLQMPWGLVSFVDLYVGFTLFSIWIAFREKSPLSSVIWIASLMILGFFVGAVYTFLAANESQGDWRRFWLGRRVDEFVEE